MSFIDQLRAATAHQHKALESSRLSKQLLSEDVTVEDYKAYLEKLSGFVVAFEKDILPQIISAFPEIVPSYKQGLLLNDIEALGNTDTSSIVTENDMQQLYPNKASMLGGLYVLEGSTLGGLVIKKHLVEKLGEQIIPATNYFSVYGKETAANWRNFLQIFSTLAMRNDSAAVIKGASDTFSFLHKWFNN